MLKKPRTFEKMVYRINVYRINEFPLRKIFEPAATLSQYIPFPVYRSRGPSQRAILGTQRSWQAVAASGVGLRTLKLAVIARDGPNEMPVDNKTKTYGDDPPLYHHRSSACRQANVSVPHLGEKKFWKGVVIVYTHISQLPNLVIVLK